VTASRPRGFDAWLFPPALPPPSTAEEIAAGGVVIRYPKSDHQLGHMLISALRASRPALTAIRTDDLIALLGSVGDRFARNALDERALARVAANAGLSRPMTREVLNGVAASWTTDALGRLVRAEFANPRALDGFVGEDGREVRAAAPGVTLHLGAGSVPGVTVTSMLRALLVKSPVLVKPGAGDAVLTTLFARELHRADSRLAAASAVCYWTGGAPARGAWERELLALADQAVVYGGDDTIEAVRSRAPASTRLVEHSHRLGVAIVDPRGAPGAAADAARAAAVFDQRGCVSTRLVLLLGDLAAARDWCGDLAAHLAKIGAALPAATPTPAELSAHHQLAGRLALQGRSTGEAGSWFSAETGWSVALAPGRAFEPAGGRTAWVVPVADAAACRDVLAPLSPALQTVGLAGIGPGRGRLAEMLSALGATRIVPLDQVPFPEPDWLHDGSRPLGELVCWSELR